MLFSLVDFFGWSLSKDFACLIILFFCSLDLWNLQGKKTIPMIKSIGDLYLFVIVLWCYILESKALSKLCVYVYAHKKYMDGGLCLWDSEWWYNMINQHVFILPASVCLCIPGYIFLSAANSELKILFAFGSYKDFFTSNKKYELSKKPILNKELDDINMIDEEGNEDSDTGDEDGGEDEDADGDDDMVSDEEVLSTLYKSMTPIVLFCS